MLKYMKNKLYALILIFTISVSMAISQEPVNTATIDVSKMKYRISKNIYGHFSEHLGHCIYGGFWVGENSAIPNVRGIRTDVVEALKHIKAPALRWPGGCFADEYHWKDGIGPRPQRPTMINTNWGGVTEDNSFGTHEFMDLCEQIGCEPYVSGNLGSGTVQELSQWIEYMNSDNVSPMTQLRKQNGHEKSWGVKFIGLGNESWGCGGNMKPEYYADLAKRYGSFCKNYGKNELKKIAVGPGDADYNWTEVVMREMGSSIWGLSLHSYTWDNGETATDVTPESWFKIMKKTLSMEELVTKHSAIMDKYDPGKSVSLVVDEWGTWYSVEPGTNPGFLFQQNTIRDALVAGTNLNIFNNHCDRVRMAAVAQVINVLQSVILTKDDKMILTPTYHVFDLYKVHQDATMVPITLKSENYTLKENSIPAINASASIDKEGKIHISICNINAEKSEKLVCNINGYKIEKTTGQILTADKLNAHNTFENPNSVTIKEFTNFTPTINGIDVNMPPHSVVVLEVSGNMDLPKTAEIKNLQPGLLYSYYQGNWQRLPDFDALKPMKSGLLKSIIYPIDIDETNFGLKYEGHIKISTDGIYDFSIVCDDGAKLYIDGNEIVNNDGLHGPIEKQGNVFLGKGPHLFEIIFFQGGGGSVLNAFIEGPGLSKQEIPEIMLFHKGEK
jgi:alpha-N-arabinofuranosidase